jgi:uncharacterized membrane protein YcaP (DUF421 family)
MPTLDFPVETSEWAMFKLDLSWWELPLRVAIVYFALLIMVRLSGKRTIGQFTPFDLLVVMLLSEAVSPSLTGGDQSISGGLLAAVTLIAFNLLVAYVTARSIKVQSWVEGRPILIGKDGVVFSEVLKRHHVPMLDMHQALREADCDQSQMKAAFLEADGKISVLQHAPHASATRG